MELRDTVTDGHCLRAQTAPRLEGFLLRTAQRSEETFSGSSWKENAPVVTASIASFFVWWNDVLLREWHGIDRARGSRGPHSALVGRRDGQAVLDHTQHERQMLGIEVHSLVRGQCNIWKAGADLVS